MSPLAAWLLALLVTLPAAPEDADARLARLQGVAQGLAQAIDLAVMTGRIPGSERRVWAAAALATAVRESGGLARAVHAGARLGDSGRSICFMQINLGNRTALKGRHARRVWRALGGIDPAATLRCAQAGVASLAVMRTYCARRVPAERLLAATLSGYMHGSSCSVLAEGARRERLTRRLLAAD
jgi:hypothetical protein